MKKVHQFTDRAKPHLRLLYAFQELHVRRHDPEEYNL